MKRKLALMIVILALLGSWSCKLFSPVDYSTNISINGKVTDQTGKAVASATVVLTGSTSTQGTSTDTSGVYHFAGVTAGTYSLTVSKTGYSTINTDQLKVDNSSTLVGNLGITNYDYTQNLDVIVYSETSAATGRVLYKLGSSNPTGAAGATVMALMEYPLASGTATASPKFQASYSATVAADGSFSFPALPAASAVSFVVVEWTSPAPQSIAYAEAAIPNGATATFDLRSGKSTLVLADVLLSPKSSAPVVLTSNLSTTFNPKTGTIALTFSRALNTTSSVFYLQAGIATPILLNPAWAADAKSVTLTPVAHLALATTYTLKYSLLDANGFSGASDNSLSLTTLPGIALLYSTADQTIAGTDPQVGLTDTLTFTFNDAIDRIANMSLTSNSSADTTIYTLVPTILSNVLTLPMPTGLKAATGYVLTFDAYSGFAPSGTDNKTNVRKTFITKGTTGLVAVADLKLTNPTIDFMDSSLNFTFTEVSRAVKYELYGRQYMATANSSAWQFLGNVDSVFKDYYDQARPPSHAITANLASPYKPYFDTYFDDFDLSSNPIVTPFAANRKYEFKVRAIDALGNTVDSTTMKDNTNNSLTFVSDKTAPTATRGGTITAAPHIGVMATPLTLTNFEYLSGLPTAADFSLRFLNDIGTPKLASISSVTWAANQSTINIIVNFGTGFTVVTDDYISVTITDTSGNRSSPIIWTF